MNKNSPAPPGIDPDKRRAVLESFERLGQKLITQLSLETFFASAQKMPHWSEVYESCQSAFVRHIATESTIRGQHNLCDRLVAQGAGADPVLKARIKELRSRYRKRDHALDRWILVAWVNRGLWLFSNDDRRLLMKLWLRDLDRFPALASSDAFRKRWKRLGLLGWNDFRFSYPDAPLHIPDANSGGQVTTDRRWKDIFLPVLCSSGEG